MRKNTLDTSEGQEQRGSQGVCDCQQKMYSVDQKVILHLFVLKIWILICSFYAAIYDSKLVNTILLYDFCVYMCQIRIANKQQECNVIFA